MDLKIRQKINQTTKKKYIFISLMLLIPMVQFAIFYVYMNMSNIILAFQGMNADGSVYWLKDPLENFKYVLTGADSKIIFISLKNNITMFFITWFIGMPLNILYGYYLFKKKAGHQVIRILFMLPGMISGVVIAMLFMKFVEVGLPAFWQEAFGKVMPNLLRNNDTAFGVQIVYSLWLGFSSSIIIYSNAMNAMDPEIFEAGRIDGTTNLTELYYLVVPMMMPTLSTYIITGFAGMLTASGSLFVFYGLNGAPEQANLLGYYLFQIAKNGVLEAYPRAAATSLLMTVVTVPVTLLVRWILDKMDPMKDNYKGIA